MLDLLIFIVIAYVIGSFSSAIIVSKLAHLPDPRQHGSGNPGATNVLRTGNKKAAILVLVGDLCKGLVAIWLARLFGVEGVGLSLVGAFAVAGHIFPVFYKFKGGKGVATAAGVLLALKWPLALMVFLIWAVVLFLSKYVSLASITAAASAIIFALVLHPFPYELGITMIAVLIVYRHYENITRLIDKTESKIRL